MKWQALNLIFQQIYHKVMVISLISISPACTSMMVYFTIQNVYVAVAGRKRNIIPITFDKFYRVYTVITQSQNKLKYSKSKVTNPNLFTMTVPTFGLNC